jgi:hypothetical protein
MYADLSCKAMGQHADGRDVRHTWPVQCSALGRLQGANPLPSCNPYGLLTIVVLAQPAKAVVHFGAGP